MPNSNGLRAFISLILPYLLIPSCTAQTGLRASEACLHFSLSLPHRPHFPIRPLHRFPCEQFQGIEQGNIRPFLVDGEREFRAAEDHPFRAPHPEGEDDGLEYEHLIPFSHGGPSTTDNLTLRCRTHNKLAALKYFERKF